MHGEELKKSEICKEESKMIKFSFNQHKEISRKKIREIDIILQRIVDHIMDS